MKTQMVSCQSFDPSLILKLIANKNLKGKWNTSVIQPVTFTDKKVMT